MFYAWNTNGRVIVMTFNSLHPGKLGWGFKCVIFKCILVIDDYSICSETALRKMPQSLNDEKSKIIKPMAWCSQETSHGALSEPKPIINIT